MRLKRDLVNSIRRARQACFQQPERPQLDRDQPVDSQTAGRTDDSTVCNMKMHDVVMRDLVPCDTTATDALKGQHIPGWIR